MAFFPFHFDVLDGLLQVTRMTHHIGGAELGHIVDNQENAQTRVSVVQPDCVVPDQTLTCVITAECTDGKGGSLLVLRAIFFD